MRYKWRKVQQCSKPAIKFSPLLSFSESLWPFKIKGKFENAQLHIWRIPWQHMPSLPSLTTDERVLLHWKQSISTRICHSQKKSQKPPTLGKPLFNTSREPFRWKGHSDRRDNIKEQSDYWRNQLRLREVFQLLLPPESTQGTLAGAMTVSSPSLSLAFLILQLPRMLFTLQRALTAALKTWFKLNNLCLLLQTTVATSFSGASYL